MKDIFKEAIEHARAERCTELAWCKCVEGCMCDHCKPTKMTLARKQFEEVINVLMKGVESEMYPMRNQTHTLSEEAIIRIIKDYYDHRRNRRKWPVDRVRMVSEMGEYFKFKTRPPSKV